MVEEFEQAAFALEAPGDMFGIVESRFGLHRILLTEKAPRDPIPVDEVEDRIIAKLQRERQRELVDAWVEGIAPCDAFLLSEDGLAAMLARLGEELGLRPPAAPAPPEQ